MLRPVSLLLLISAAGGCTILEASKDPGAPNRCYAESGYLDSTNGCSARAGYPDCYLVCPDKGTRNRL